MGESSIGEELNTDMRLLTNSREPESFFRSHHMLSNSRIYQHSMKPEGSLPCTQELAIGPRPQAD
jgi:hypothetical protein